MVRQLWPQQIRGNFRRWIWEDELEEVARERRGYGVKALPLLCEVGKKFPENDDIRRNPHELDVPATINAFRGYIDMGTQGNYLEGHVLRAVLGDNGERPAGRDALARIADKVGLEHIIFEIPGTFLPYAGKRILQGNLVYLFGPDVSMGNILVEEIPELEEVRDGLFPNFGAPHGDHPWLHSVINSGTGRAGKYWWQGK